MSNGPRGQPRLGRAVCLFLAASWALGVACLGPVRGACDHEACPDGQYCDVEGRVCVAAGGPVVAIESPSEAALDAGAITLRGRVNPLARAGEAAYRLQGAGDWTPLGLDPEGRFERVLTLPPLDRATLVLEVRASSPAQAYLAVASPTVDNVSPRIDFGVAEGEFGVARDLVFGFSEPVTPSRSDWLFLAQPEGALADTVDGGTWSADRRHFSLEGLPYNRPVRARVGAGFVRDDFGNALAETASVLFVTEPEIPPAGPVVIGLDAGSTLSDFVAETSLDGVVNFAVKTTRGGTPESLYWLQFGSDTGNLLVHDVVSANGNAFQVFSGFYLETGSDPPPLARVGGMHRRDGADTGYTRWREGSAFFTNTEPSQTALVAVPAVCGESGELRVGRVRLQGANSWYRRTALSERALPVRTQTVGLRSLNSWQLIGQSVGALEVVEMRGDCSASGTAHLSGKLVLATGLVTPDAQLSSALPPGGRSLYVYDLAGGGRVEACFACVELPNGDACPPEDTRTAEGQELRVVAGRSGNEVLGARRGTSGRIELLRRSLDVCSSDWEVIESIAGTETATRFVPVRYGNAPGVLYLQSGQIRVYR